MSRSYARREARHHRLVPTTPTTGAVLAAAALLLAACGDDTEPAATPPSTATTTSTQPGGTDDELVRALDDAGFYAARPDEAADRRRVVRRFHDGCDRLDADAGRENDTRYEYLVSFFRSDSSIAATNGWPAARIATIAIPILCPAHQAVLDRAVGTVT